MANYDLFSIDLATAGSAPKRLVEVSKQIATIYVLSLPAGVNVLLAIGQRQPFPLKFLGQSVRLIPPERDGLYVTVPAPQSGVVQLLVGYGSNDPEASAPEFYGSGIDALTAYNRLAAGNISLVTPAGIINNLQLFNPVGSGVIALLSDLEINRDPEPMLGVDLHATSILAGRWDTQFATNFPTVWRDGRQAGAPACRVGRATGATAVTNIEQIAVAPPGRSIILAYALAPGQGYVVQTIGDPAVSLFFQATFRFQEVPT